MKKKKKKNKKAKRISKISKIKKSTIKSKKQKKTKKRKKTLKRKIKVDKKIKENQILLKLIRFQSSLKPKIKISFNPFVTIDTFLQKFFTKISDTINEYKVLQKDETRRKKIEEIQNNPKVKRKTIISMLDSYSYIDYIKNMYSVYNLKLEACLISLFSKLKNV